MSMHDIWNPWHGCTRISEGCEHCYMMDADAARGNDGTKIYKTVTGFNYPLSRNRDGWYKVDCGEQLRVCMNSDFFIEEADQWREDAWQIISERPDVKFFLLTKRANRIKECLPHDWYKGWDNVMISVTCENQVRADERIPYLLDIPAKHKGIMCAPFIGEVNIEKYLETEQIEQVICDGERCASGARPCNYDWVKSLRQQCEKYNISFTFIGTGTHFIKDGKMYNLPQARLQSRMAHKSGISFVGKPIKWNLYDRMGLEITEQEQYKPTFNSEWCQECGSRQICNGCSACGLCGYKGDNS